MNKFIAVALFSLSSLFAAAQGDYLYSYEGDGFYVRLISASDLRIGSTSDMRFVTEEADDDEQKVEVDVCKGLNVSGYSTANREINDADFFINDNGTEMMAETPRAARNFVFYMGAGVKTGVSLKVYVANSQAASGRSVKYLEIPAKVVSEIVSAQRYAPRR